MTLESGTLLGTALVATGFHPAGLNPGKGRFSIRELASMRPFLWKRNEIEFYFIPISWI